MCLKSHKNSLVSVRIQLWADAEEGEEVRRYFRTQIQRIFSTPGQIFRNLRLPIDQIISKIETNQVKF